MYTIRIEHFLKYDQRNSGYFNSFGGGKLSNFFAFLPMNNHKNILNTQHYLDTVKM